MASKEQVQKKVEETAAEEDCFGQFRDMSLSECQACTLNVKCGEAMKANGHDNEEEQNGQEQEQEDTVSTKKSKTTKASGTKETKETKETTEKATKASTPDKPAKVTAKAKTAPKPEPAEEQEQEQEQEQETKATAKAKTAPKTKEKPAPAPEKSKAKAKPEPKEKTERTSGPANLFPELTPAEKELTAMVKKELKLDLKLMGANTERYFRVMGVKGTVLMPNRAGEVSIIINHHREWRGTLDKLTKALAKLTK